MRYLLCMPGEAMMSLMPGALGMHGHASGAEAIVHVAAPEPSHTGRWVWSHRTRGDTRALPGGGPGALDMW
jgi:hypothetical protein